LVDKYTVQQFCREFGFAPEYIRQCCRQQLTPDGKQECALPSGWKAKKLGKRWLIVSCGAEILKATRRHRLIVLETEERALIDVLLEKWHQTALQRSNKVARPKAELIQAIREAYLEAVSGRSGNWVECRFRFKLDGNYKIEVVLPNRFRQLAIDSYLRASEKSIAELKMQFLAVWLSELNYIKVKRGRSLPASFTGDNNKKSGELRKLCINCGFKHGKRSGARFCGDLCRDAHRNWLKRLPKSREILSLRINKRFVDKVLPQL
jgi:hypothetical protein